MLKVYTYFARSAKHCAQCSVQMCQFKGALAECVFKKLQQQFTL